MRNRLRWDVVLGVVIFIDVLRVFLPSLITLFGQAGGTPAEYMGLYAISWFLAAFLTIPLARLISTRHLALAGAAGLLLARIVLQLSDGGDLQLYTASAGVLAGLVWLIATAMGTRDTSAAMNGFVAGLTLSTVIHAALAQTDLMWRTWYVAWPLLLIELAAFGWLMSRTASADAQVGAARNWLLCGPAILLWGLYIGNTAQISSTGEAGSVTSAVTVGVLVLVTVGALSRRMPRPPAIVRLLIAVVLVLTAAGFAWGNLTFASGGLPSLVSLLIVVLGQLALVMCLPAAEPATRHSPVGNGLAAAGGMSIFVVLIFGYYAAYDLYLPNWWVPVLAALVVLVVVSIGGPPNADQAVAPPGKPAPVLQFSLWNRSSVIAAVAAACLVAVAPLWQGSSPAVRPPEDGLRVAAYNVRMGYGLDGALSLDAQADALAALNPHVIVLSEVDRGWFLNGGHDDLRHIADRLDMGVIWAPAADGLWGDAVLTNLSVSSAESHVLVQGGPTGAQALELVFTWQDTDITLIATHLQPPPDWRPLDQVEQLADIVSDAANPVVLAGDLNLEPGSQAWNVLMETGLTDPFAAGRPLPTIPGDSPEQIDHILVSPGLTGSDPANPDLPHSDHRPIAVTLRL